MVAKKLLDEANKNAEVLKNANKTQRQLEEQNNLSLEFHRHNSHKFAMAQIRQNEKLADYNKLKQETQPEWAEIMKTAESWVNGSQAGYDTFVSASSSQVKFICEIAPVAVKKIHIGFGGLPYTELGQYINAFYQSIIPPTFSDPEHFEAPEIECEIALTDDNALTITKLERKDKYKDPNGRFEKELTYKEEITPAQVMAFQSGVVAWLMSRGYEPSSTEPGKFHDKISGNELTQDALNMLNQDPKNLNAYFEKLRVAANKTAPAKAKAEKETANKERQASSEAWEKTAKEEAAKKRKEAAERKAEAEDEPSKTPRPN